MKKLTLLGFLLILFSTGLLANINKTYGVLDIDGDLYLFSVDLTDGTRDTIDIIPNVTSYKGSSSAFDAENEYFIFNSNLGITVVDVNDASVVNSYSDTSGLNLVEYYKGKVYGILLLDSDMHLFSLDLTDGTRDTIDVIANVDAFLGGNSTFDSENGYFIIISNLGFTVIDVEDASVVNAYPAPGVNLIEYYNDKVYSTLSFGLDVYLYSVNIVNGTRDTFDIIPNVNSFVGSVTTFDSENGYFIINSNLGLTVVDVKDASIVNTYPDFSSVYLVEYYDQFTSSIGLNRNDPEVLIYPNPTWGDIELELKTGRNVEVMVSSLKGEVLYSVDKMDFNTLSLPLKGPAGLYLVTVKSDKGSKTYKVLKR